MRGFPQAKPSRQPAMLYDFVSEKNSTPTSFAPRSGQEGRRAVAVEDEVRVREVVDDPEAVLPREVDDALEEGRVGHLGRRVVGEVEEEALRLRPREAHRLLQAGEELAVALAGDQRDGAEVAVGDHDRVGVDRVGGVRHQDGVARLEEGQHQVGEPFLRADRGDGLGLGVQLDAEALPVPAGDGDPEPADAARGRVAVVPRVLRGLDELVDDVPGRRAIRVAHAEVDDVLAPGPRLDLEVGDRGQDVGRQPLDPIEIVHLSDPPRDDRA